MYTFIDWTQNSLPSGNYHEIPPRYYCPYKNASNNVFVDVCLSDTTLTQKLLNMLFWFYYHLFISIRSQGNLALRRS